MAGHSLLEASGTGTVLVQPIKPRIMASRTAGVAPLAVFFDATETTGLTNDDYVTAAFSWDFGDTNAGVWPTTGRNRNAATGFLAVHVYEQPGHYTVTLSVTDKGGDNASATLAIDVADFSGTTYYVSSLSGDDVNDGLAPDPAAGAHGPWKTLAKAAASAGNDFDINTIRDSNLRILFKRGETFVADATMGIALLHVNPAGATPKGPLILGAYGSGAKPVLLETASDTSLLVLANDCHDVRVMDLELSGPYIWGTAGPGENSCGVFSGTDVSEVLLLDVDVHHFNYGVLWGQEPLANLFIVGCDLHHNAMVGYGSNGGSNLAVVGSTISNTNVGHNVYSYLHRNCYVAHSVFARPGWDDRFNGSRPANGRFYSNQCNLRLAIADADAQNIVITDNHCTDGEARIQVGLMDASAVGIHYENVLIERNVTDNPTNAFWFTVGIFLDAVRHAVVRNNVLLTGPDGPGDVAIALDTYASRNPQCRPTSDVSICHNSACNGYARGQVSTARFLAVGRNDSDNLTVANNIAAVIAPAGTAIQGIGLDLPTDFDLRRLVSDANVWYFPDSPVFAWVGWHGYVGADWMALGQDRLSMWADPLFVNPATGDLHLRTVGTGYPCNSPAVDLGTWVPVLEDLDHLSRPAGIRADAGAFESPANLPAPVARLSLRPSRGPAPLTVGFDASASTPGAGAVISDYAYDFLGTGVFIPGRATISYLYPDSSANTTYTVRLRVTDSLGRTAETTESVTVTVPHTISGQLTLDDYAGDASQVDVGVELRQWEGPTTSRTIRTASDGSYSLPDVGFGTYDLAFKAGHWLRRIVTGVAVHADQAQVNAILINGDCDNNNAVDSTDLSVLLAVWGTQSGSSNYDSRADVDANGAVDSTDLAILLAAMDSGSGSPNYKAPADINGDGIINSADLAILLAAMDSLPKDPNYTSAADLDGNGTVDDADLAILTKNIDLVGD